MSNHIRALKKPYIVNHIWSITHGLTYIRWVQVKDKGYKCQIRGTNLLIAQGYKSMMVGTSCAEVLGTSYPYIPTIYG